MPAAVFTFSAEWEIRLFGVMIGIDPPKQSHTAFALDASETKLGQLVAQQLLGRW